ncbi:6777_t:CDS:1 [Gigaspora rosea]|nr:6777_t:CDS:1 [Gigaspora rosea]
MDPFQFMEVGEVSSSSFRNDMPPQFFFENNLPEVEPFSISSSYETEDSISSSYEPEDILDMDSSDEENEELALKIYEGQEFQTWNDIEIFLKQYGLEQGFSIRRRRTESFLEDGNQVLRKVSWECGCSGNYQTKKV